MAALSLVLFTLLNASPDLDDGRLAYSALKYDKAISSLKRVAEDASLPESERLEALGLLARSYLALGKQDEAKAAWSSLLALSPLASAPQGSPKVKASFKQAKEAKFPPRFVQLTKLASAPDVLEAELINPWSIDLTVELWEAVGAGAFEKKLVAVNGSRVVSSLRAGSRNYLRVVGADGVLLTSLANPNEPIAGPAAPLVVDSPRQPPSLVPAPVILVSASPEPSAAPSTGWSARSIAAVVIAGLGLAALVTGGIFFALGLNEKSLADGWPLNSLDYDTATQYATTGPQKMITGGIFGGVGLAGLITGAVLFFTTPSPTPP